MMLSWNLWAGMLVEGAWSVVRFGFTTSRMLECRMLIHGWMMFVLCWQYPVKRA